MSRAWKFLQGFVLLACLAVTTVVAGIASAQSEDRNRDERQQASNVSNRDSDDSSNGDRSDARDRDREQSRDSDRDRNERPESRRDKSQSRSDDSSRDQNRRAPQMSNRQRSEEDRSDEQGGLGVAVEDAEQGVRVVQVYANTPAQEMGLRAGDVITQVDGHDIDSARDFISRIRRMDPGEDVALDVLRNHNERSVSGELESRDEALRLRNRRYNGQSEYGQDRSDSYSSTRSNREGDALNRLYAIERQLDQLRRELQQLKSSLEQGGGNRESSVIYYEPTQRRSDRFSTRQSQFEDSSRFDNRRGVWDRADENRSPGGVTGEGRLHTTGRESND